MPSAPSKSDAEKREELRNIVKNARTAFFVTVSTDSSLHGRPMANAGVDDDLRAIWFATDRNSGKSAELQSNPRVLLGYTNSSGVEWASVGGTAALVDDRAKINELWSPFWKNWFDGPDDPRIQLIRVTPSDAEYWDSGNKILAMLKLGIAAVTGKKLNEGVDEHLKL